MAEESATPLQELTATKIPNDVLLRFLRLDPAYVDKTEQATVDLMYRAAISHLVETYGLDEGYLDTYPDMAIAVLVLVRDMYDNRTLYVDKANVNRTVECIMASHDMNLL
ncbi:head-tail connector protein [Raoultibacter timonensis]|uniref:head-tail connector protein n=1 Tax=Raoultibacter timonensis TaxID=1907662 RepID=UPI0026DBD89D|nr:head-tail connector protein [Raoultibacter timonensis]